MSKMIPPSPTGYTIYTKSGCKWCTHAKRVFADAMFVSCDEWLMDRDCFLEQMDKYTGGYRTFPMIFNNRVFIGGYNEALNMILTDLNF